MALTKIGTKLLANGAITTVKLGSTSVNNHKIQSGSVEVGHIDVNSGRSDHVTILDADYFIIGDKSREARSESGSVARGLSFAQLKTALSSSHNVCPVIVFFKPAKATISPALASFMSSLELACIKSILPTRSSFSLDEL